MSCCTVGVDVQCVDIQCVEVQCVEVQWVHVDVQCVDVQCVEVQWVWRHSGCGGTVAGCEGTVGVKAQWV